MAGTDTADSPLERAAGAAGPEAAERFELLSNDTRMAILLALWEAYEPRASRNTVGFSELRDRVGVRDSGQFNYHLGKLEGTYVDKTDDGYRLRPSGLKLVGTVIAGTGRTRTLEPTEIDVPCDICGAPSAVQYDDGWLFQVCTECPGGFGHTDEYPHGTLFAEPFPPAALENRTVEEIFASGVFRLVQVMAMKLGGLCPRCSGVMDEQLTVCEDHDPSDSGPCPSCGYMTAARLHWVCTVCKYQGGSSPAGAMMMHPAVMGFYHDHGVEVGIESNTFDGARELLALMRNHEQTVLGTDPVRIEVRVTYDEDELRLTLDEEMNVLSVDRTG